MAAKAIMDSPRVSGESKSPNGSQCFRGLFSCWQAKSKSWYSFY